MNVDQPTVAEPIVLLTLGMLFLLGLAADLVGRNTPLPRVTLLLLAGLLIGPSGFAVLPESFVDAWFPLLTDIALSMVGFLLGQKVTLVALRERGRVVLWMSIGKVAGASLAVGVALVLLGVDLRIALLLAGIAPATAPAAIYDVVKEAGAKGNFSDNLLSIVAIDDAWGLLLFAFMMAAAASLGGENAIESTLRTGIFEIGGSFILGLGLGLPMAFMTGRIRSGEPTQAEAMGFVLLCAGAAISLHLSPILTAMVMGSTVASFASHHTRPFHAIEGFEWSFMIFFFVLAGASLHIDTVTAVGWIGVTYILARAVGIYAGARTGGALARADTTLRRWLGLALLPQAGVALGMALLASQRFPELADVILSVVLATTVVLEIIAPIITRRVLIRVGDTQNKRRMSHISMSDDRGPRTR
ncbi:MAG: cation:proton antiporter [Gammaproteobacteria bacterium]